MTLDDTLSEIEERWKPLEEKETDVNAGDPSKQKELSESSLLELRVRVLCRLGYILCDCGCNAWIKAGDKTDPIRDLPDYCNDLNACAESFEEEIAEAPDTIENDARRTRYRLELEKLCGYKAIHFATAEQRCRAFVAVMEASVPSSDADSVSTVTESADASRASSPKSSLSPEIVIPS